MARLDAHSTWALHIACADRCHGIPFPDGSTWTWRDAFTHWGNSYLRRLGHRIPEAAA